MAAVLKTYDLWNLRIPTARLNRWLDGTTQAHPPPLVAGKRIKIRYMTQIKTRPPTFALFAAKGEELPDAYHRYLMNGIRESFGLLGVPLRLVLRKGVNPFDKKGDGPSGQPGLREFRVKR
jgi:GTP-binding protein